MPLLQPLAMNTPPPLTQLSTLPLQQGVPPPHPLGMRAYPYPPLYVSLQGIGLPPLLPSAMLTYTPMLW